MNVSHTKYCWIRRIRLAFIFGHIQHIEELLPSEMARKWLQ